MFDESASLGQQLSASAVAATEQVKAWESLLELRIGLQRALDLGNRLPLAFDDDILSTAEDLAGVADAKGDLVVELEGLLHEMTGLLEMQTDETTGARRGGGSAAAWTRIESAHEGLRDSWESTVNKWHARVHFGSEKVKSKMKVFNQTIWQQIDVVLDDDARVIEKSRPVWADSNRVDKDDDPSTAYVKSSSSSARRGSFGEDDDDKDDDDDDDKTGRPSKRVGRQGAEDTKYDLECYDDRPFYSLLLKSFIESSAAAAGSAGGQGMRGEDLEALRRYKRSKTNVDRKASKGRKIRYTRHPKLESFMFPVSLASLSAAGAETEHTRNGEFGSGMADAASSSRFFQSLFQ